MYFVIEARMGGGAGENFPSPEAYWTLQLEHREVREKEARLLSPRSDGMLRGGGRRGGARRGFPPRGELVLRAAIRATCRSGMMMRSNPLALIQRYSSETTSCHADQVGSAPVSKRFPRSRFSGAPPIWATSRLCLTIPLSGFDPSERILRKPLGCLTSAGTTTQARVPAASHERSTRDMLTILIQRLRD